MNWYKEIKFAAPPLPSYRGIDDISYGPSKRRTGIDAIEIALTEEKAEKEKRRNPPLTYMGSGAWGIAYEPGISENIIVKYTTDDTEYISAKRILEMQEGGRNVPGIATVFYAEEIDEGIYKIYLEKAFPLTREEARMVNALSHENNNVIEEHNFNEYYEFFMSDYKKAFVSGVNLKIIREAYNKFRELIISLKPAIIWFRDVHGDNIGKNSKGDYIILDLGSISI